MVYEDDGVGIPFDEKDKVFKKGYGKNTGFGLFLIERICEDYGWTIKEDGTPNTGARFVINVPKGKFQLTSSKDENDSSE